MIKQLTSYSIIMIMNISLLWSVNVTNEILTILVIVCIFTIIPAIFVSYLLLYINYYYLDIFVSNGVHHVFVVHPSRGLEGREMTADQEYVSDVENYSEEYPDQILDDDSAASEVESLKIMTDHLDHENKSKRFRNSIRKLPFVGKKQEGSWEVVKVEVRWININD